VVVQLTVMTKGSGAAPVAIGDSYATTKNTTLVVAAPGVLTNDTDAESDGLGAFVDTPPIHGALTLSSNGGFTYTPFTDYLGPDAFTYRVTDGNSWSQLVTVALTVATSGPIDPQSDAIFRDGFEAPPLPSVAKAAFVSQADDAHSGHFVIDAATMQGALAIEPWAAWTLSSPNGSAIAAVELRELGGGYEVRAAVSTEGRWAYSAWTQIERDELIFVDWSSPYYASDSVNLEVRTSLSSRRIKLGSDSRNRDAPGPAPRSFRYKKKLTQQTHPASNFPAHFPYKPHHPRSAHRRISSDAPRHPSSPMRRVRPRVVSRAGFR
jgi:hypothetical protein